uniref:Uncharacterized protein n=1 Tax=Romanomermis culicivorax TaxID=13658 RepID=A0A915JMU2_ROMCU
MALHLVESPNSGYTHYGYMVLINYLTNAALVSEEKLANLTRQIQIYENMLISRKYGPNSSSTGANIRDVYS